MCGGKVAKTDPEAEAQAAADKAAAEANKKKALRNSAKQGSLLASAADTSNTATSGAKTTLGGG